MVASGCGALSRITITSPFVLYGRHIVFLFSCSQGTYGLKPEVKLTVVRPSPGGDTLARKLTLHISDSS